MPRKIVAKVGEFQKDGQTKSRWQNVGVIMSNDNGEYILLDPLVSMAGILSAQNALAMTKGDQVRDRVMCSVFEDDNQGGGYQQPQQRQQTAQQQAPQHPHANYFGDDTPFN